MSHRIKVYLAGWDVFRPDSLEFGQKLKNHCDLNNLEGLYPLDNHIPQDITHPKEVANWIYNANVTLIRQCDIVMANVNSFRGAEPDSGTAFEIGFAQALNKQVYIYLDNTCDMLDHLNTQPPEYMSSNKLLDKNGMTVENFNLPVNLMLSVPSIIFKGSAFECIEKISHDLGQIKKVKKKSSR